MMKKIVFSLCLGAMTVLGAEKSAVFPLMAWDYVDDKPTLEAMSDCGITCVAFVRPRLLDACKQYHLQGVVFDERFAGTNWDGVFDGGAAVKAFPQLLKETRNHPAVMGYHIKDEPHARDFPELAKAVAVVKEMAPGKWPYINLFPGEGDSYDKYVQSFVDICKPAALSYDRYSLYKEGEIGANFWSNLAQMRALAKTNNLPFWNIVLTSTHWGYREITEADLRLQNWASLAYGVSGIAYYKFCSKEVPILDAADLGNFRNGPLDQFGEKTQTWHWLRNLNRQMQNLAPVYLKLRSDEVYHIGDVPTRNRGVSETSLVKSMPKGDYVVGDFTHPDGTRYVLLVNKSLEASVRCDPTFNVTVKKLEYVSPITSKTAKFPKPYYWLAPGQGVLLRLQQ